MKSRMIQSALAASLMLAAGVASAQQMYYRTAPVPGQSNADTYSAAPMNHAEPLGRHIVRRRTDGQRGLGQLGHERQRIVQAVHARAAVQHFLR